MEFIRSHKAQRIPSSTSSSKQPQGTSSKEDFTLRNVSRESDSSSAASLQKPQEVTMEGGEEEEEEGDQPSPPSAMGMMDSK